MIHLSGQQFVIGKISISIKSVASILIVYSQCFHVISGGVIVNDNNNQTPDSDFKSSIEKPFIVKYIDLTAAANSDSPNSSEEKIEPRSDLHDGESRKLEEEHSGRVTDRVEGGYKPNWKFDGDWTASKPKSEANVEKDEVEEDDEAGKPAWRGGKVELKQPEIENIPRMDNREWMRDHGSKSSLDKDDDDLAKLYKYYESQTHMNDRERASPDEAGYDNHEQTKYMADPGPGPGHGSSGRGDQSGVNKWQWGHNEEINEPRWDSKFDRFRGRQHDVIENVHKSHKDRDQADAGDKAEEVYNREEDVEDQQQNGKQPPRHLEARTVNDLRRLRTNRSNLDTIDV
ncbi:uncharacterized protein LOC141854934 isoform X2 [Brevipalpus obovatus]|uniref:uncharacterized protein LOC141854934 isoform X2 n=1 Tax=Brevipalpus obovatus TaxID=246614 RepID=UPI003D9E59DF